MGGMLGNKRQDRGKTNSGGQRFWGGGLFGEMPKKGWKNFLAVPKSGGEFFWGSYTVRGGFSGKLSKQNLGGIF